LVGVVERGGVVRSAPEWAQVRGGSQAHRNREPEVRVRRKVAHLDVRVPVVAVADVASATEQGIRFISKRRIPCASPRPRRGRA
jgi:hypothetical protein